MQACKQVTNIWIVSSEINTNKAVFVQTLFLQKKHKSV